MATNYSVNMDDERFKTVEESKAKSEALLSEAYDDAIRQADSVYSAQLEATKDWEKRQTELQNERTDLAIERIEQQKDQAKQDYTKEQSGAYVDWQKQSNQYGANAEQMAAQGLQNSGYSESSQVSMYNTYQNRVATARDSYNKTILNYENAIKDAQMQNNATLAQIAYESMQAQLELSLEALQYQNTLKLEKVKAGLDVDNMYYTRYQDVLDQINAENAMQEQIRQYNQNYELQMKEYEEGIRQFNEEIARLKANDERDYSIEIQRLQLQRESLEEEMRQFNLEHSNDSLLNGTGIDYLDVLGIESGRNVSGGNEWEQAGNYITRGKYDMQSLANAGFANKTPDEVMELLEDGVLEMYEENGTIKFRLKN